MFLFILFWFFHHIFSLEIKSCTNCKFIIRCDNNLLYSQCFLFPKITKEIELKKKQDLIKLLVTGVQSKPSEHSELFFHCSTAREFDCMCGINGTKFVTNAQPSFNI